MKFGLAPVVDQQSRILVLGSLPGELSLQKQEYYGHPRNAFWPLMADLLGEELPSVYSEKCDQWRPAMAAHDPTDRF